MLALDGVGGVRGRPPIDCWMGEKKKKKKKSNTCWFEELLSLIQSRIDRKSRTSIGKHYSGTVLFCAMEVV